MDQSLLKWKPTPKWNYRSPNRNICIWVNFWQFQDSWIFEECWMWWQELGQRQMGCQGWPGVDAAICMMITRSAHSGALVTIRQCNCHNGLGPGQEERGLRTVSHRNPENLLPYGWKWVLNKLLTCELVRDTRPILELTHECGDINLHVIFMGPGWWDIVYVKVPITGWPVCSVLISPFVSHIGDEAIRDLVKQSQATCDPRHPAQQPRGLTNIAK